MLTVVGDAAAAAAAAAATAATAAATAAAAAASASAGPGAGLREDGVHSAAQRVNDAAAQLPSSRSAQQGGGVEEQLGQLVWVDAALAAPPMRPTTSRLR